MIYCQGAGAINLEQTVLGVLRAHLVTTLGAAPHTATFSKWRGVEVTLDDTAAAKFWNAKKPFIFLSVQNGDHEFKPWRDHFDNQWRFGTRHILTVTAEIISSDFGGHKIGAANPISVTALLRDALQYVVDNGKVALSETGLYHAGIKPDRSRMTDPNLFNPHSISFEAYTLKA